jgi:hypothetical protein
MYPGDQAAADEVPNRRTNSIANALLGCFVYDAVDERDKIFALIGLSSDAGESAFDPEYTAPPEAIYTRLSRQL